MGCGYKPTYEARDPWTASYLFVMDVPCLAVYISPAGKARWVFDNTDGDAAWRHSAEWRDETLATVNGPALMRAYREMSRRAAEARADQGAKTNDRRIA